MLRSGEPELENLSRLSEETERQLEGSRGGGRRLSSVWGDRVSTVTGFLGPLMVNWVLVITLFTSELMWLWNCSISLSNLSQSTMIFS